MLLFALDDMGLFFERTYPLCVGVIIFGATLACAHFGVTLPNSESMLSSLVTLGGIFTGFVATAQTILAGMRSETQQRLLSSGYMSELRSYLQQALWVSFALCAMSIAGFFDALKNVHLFIALLFGLAAFSLASLYRVARIAMNLMMGS